MNSRLDHKMVGRLCLGLILMVLVTASIKGWAFKKRARFLTPGIAHKYFIETGLASDLDASPMISKKVPLDGWGHPFFWIAKSRILVSAGQDERFQTDDDLYFGWVHYNCSAAAREWMLKQDFNETWNFHSLPERVFFKPQGFALQTPSGICPLPDLAGQDELSGTEDDLRSLRLLEPGKVPYWKDVLEELKAQEKQTP